MEADPLMGEWGRNDGESIYKATTSTIRVTISKPQLHKDSKHEAYDRQNDQR